MAEKEALQWRVHVARVDYGDSGWQLPSGVYESLATKEQFGQRCQVTVANT